MQKGSKIIIIVYAILLQRDFLSGSLAKIIKALGNHLCSIELITHSIWRCSTFMWLYSFLLSMKLGSCMLRVESLKKWVNAVVNALFLSHIWSIRRCRSLFGLVGFLQVLVHTTYSLSLKAIVRSIVYRSSPPLSLVRAVKRQQHYYFLWPHKLCL